MIPADVTDEAAAKQILADVRADILVLNAGAPPRMGSLDRLSWADFTATWETDVKAGLYWIQAVLNLPLAPGARVLVSSSGAAQNGSPLSGGYGCSLRSTFERRVFFQHDFGIMHSCDQVFALALDCLAAASDDAKQPRHDQRRQEDDDRPGPKRESSEILYQRFCNFMDFCNCNDAPGVVVS